MNKTEQPTPKRLREAVRSGDVAKSRILFGAALTAGAMVGLRQATGALEPLLHLTRRLLSGEALEPSMASKLALDTFSRSIGAPLLGAVIAATLVQTAVLRGQAFHGRLKFDLSFLDLAKGSRRLVSTDRLKEVGFSLALAAFAGGLVALSLALRFLHHRQPGAELAGLVDTLMFPVRALELGALALPFVGGLDLVRALLARRKRLMMTKDEVRREHKAQEGDPHHKAKRQAFHRSLGSGGPARGVGAASCVVVNPTHIAVAIRYDERECDSPYVVAAARDEAALQIREEARRLHIPIVRNIPLARALVLQDIGTAVAEELFEATAAVLAVAAGQTSPTPEDTP